MGLEAVKYHEEHVWDEDFESLGAEDGDQEGEGDADLVDDRVEEKAGKGGGNVEVPGLCAPIGRAPVEDVVGEGGKFWPERGAGLPEEGINWYCDEEADGYADKTGGDNRKEGQVDMRPEVEVDGVEA